MNDFSKIGFGGGCHWCTEAVFQAIKGVQLVEQGYISIVTEAETFYEGVIVHYDAEIISLETLVRIHLTTHKSTSDHSMRSKYLSGIYFFDPEKEKRINAILDKIQKEYKDLIITKAYQFGKFKPSRDEIRNYYKTDPERPFCKVYIQPKLKTLSENFDDFTI